MTNLKSWITVLAACMVLFAAAGCSVTGKVEQGRVIAFDKKTHLVTLIPEPSSPGESGPGVLPPITVKTPADPDEMGPAPVPGKLMRVDTKGQQLVVFEAASQSFKTIPYKSIKEQHGVAKAPKSAGVDRAKKTITVYLPEQKLVVTIAASADMLAMPDDTWRAGDVVRYYYQQPDEALRFMNVTRTDLTKSGG